MFLSKYLIHTILDRLTWKIVGSYARVFAVAARLPKKVRGTFLTWTLLDEIFCFSIWIENVYKSNDSSFDTPVGLFEKIEFCLNMYKGYATDK